MTNAASAQAVEEFKKRLREFLENSEAGRQALNMSGTDDIELKKLSANGKRSTEVESDEGEEI